MDVNRQKEQFSFAYISAIISIAGFNLGMWRVDEDSVDLSITAGSDALHPSRPLIDVQVKCTATPIRGTADVVYPLRIKNYDDLRRERVANQRILVVVCVPEEAVDWSFQTENALMLRHCAYWLSLRGQPAVANREQVSVRIPRSQVFSPTVLTSIMDRLEAGELL